MAYRLNLISVVGHLYAQIFFDDRNICTRHSWRLDVYCKDRNILHKMFVEI